jgi:hypothetical protein
LVAGNYATKQRTSDPAPEAFGDYIKSEIRKYAQVVKDSAARAE